MTSTSVGARVCGAIALGASLCLAGPAFAQQTSALKIEAASGKGSLQGVGGSVFTNADTTANAALTVLPLLSFDVSGTPSIDGSNSPNNVYIVLDATPFSTVDQVAFDVTITGLGASWLSEFGLRFGNSDGQAVNLRPGSGVNNPGTGSFSGTASLVDLGISFDIGADGKLYLQFFETFDDGPGTDGIWDSGTVSFGNIGVVPEPATYGLMALGLLGIGVAARRRQAD